MFRVHAEKWNSAFLKRFFACMHGDDAVRVRLPQRRGKAIRGDGGEAAVVLRENFFARVVDSKKNRD